MRRDQRSRPCSSVPDTKRHPPPRALEAKQCLSVKMSPRKRYSKPSARIGRESSSRGRRVDALEVMGSRLPVSP